MSNGRCSIALPGADTTYMIQACRGVKQKQNGKPQQANKKIAKVEETLTCWEGMVYCTGLFEFDPLSELVWFNILLSLLFSRLLFITVGPVTKNKAIKESA